MSGIPDLRTEYAAEGLNPKSDLYQGEPKPAEGPMPPHVKKPEYQLGTLKLGPTDVERIYKELTTLTDGEVVKEFLKYRQSPKLLNEIDVKIRSQDNAYMRNVWNLYTQYSSFNVEDIGDAIIRMFEFTDQVLVKIKEISDYLEFVGGELGIDDKSYNDFIRKAYELFNEYKSLLYLVENGKPKPGFAEKVETIKRKEMVNYMITISQTLMPRGGGVNHEYIYNYLKEEKSKQGGLKKSKNYKKSRKSRKSRKYPKSRKSRKSRKYYH